MNPDPARHKIAVFDSGVGGLSIFQAITVRRPDLSVVYCSDNLGFPYGSRSVEEVTLRTASCLSMLAQRHNLALAVIACNTASTVALPTVRSQLNLPVVGVIPAIKSAAARTRNGCIGLLATPGTVRREYTDQLIEEFAHDCEVIRVGNSELVHLAEHYVRGQTVDIKRLQAILRPLSQGSRWPDCVVLGCTHFPLIQPLLEQVTPQPTCWIDSGDAIARRVNSLLPPLPNHHERPASAPRHLFVHTGGSDPVLVPVVRRMGFDSISALMDGDYTNGVRLA